ncbi:MAG: hypothetical protein V3U53_09935 [bacterium]
MRTLLRKWRSGWSAGPPVPSGMKGPISLRLRGGLVRSAAQGASRDSGGDDRPWDFEVVIARPGYSLDGRWFLTPSVLREAAPLFEGTQAFANHAPPEGPDIKDLVGWHRDVRVTEEGLVSSFTVSKSAGWFHAMAHDALDRGIEEPFGFSFDVLAETEFREESGGLVLHFLKIVAVNSVDVVHKGRLGGALVGIAAAVPGGGGEETAPRASNPDMEVKMFETLFGKLKASAPEVAARLGERWTPQQLFPACEEAGFEWDIAGSGGRADSRELLARRLSASALPEAVKEKLRAQLAGRVFSEGELDEAIRLESSTLEKLTASGALRGFGASVEVVKDEYDRKKDALDGLWDPVPKVRDGHRPYRFLSEGFQDFTGHRLSPQRFFAETFHYHRASEDWNGIRRLSASLDTSTWGQAFGDSIRRAMLRDFRDERFHQWKKIASSVVPVKDFRTNRRVRVGGYGDLTTVSEQATYPALASPTDEEVTYAVAKRGGIEDLTWEMIQNDDLEQLRNQLGQVISFAPDLSEQTLELRLRDTSFFLTAACLADGSKTAGGEALAGGTRDSAVYA